MALDIGLVVLSALITACLAGVGIEMANHPPANDRQRLKYRLSFIGLSVVLIICTLWQSVRNTKAQEQIHQEARDEQRRQDQQYSDLKAKLDLIASLPPSLTQAQVAEAVRGIVKAPPPVPLPGTMTNAELRDKAEKLIARIRQLEIDRAKTEADLIAYWSANPLPPDSVNRDRLKEFNGNRDNAKFQFDYTMLQEYVYLFQEVINRIPDKILRKASYGDKKSMTGGWLAASGLFGSTTIDYNQTAQKLQDLLALLPQ
jgi:hypothetical protein